MIQRRGRAISDCMPEKTFKMIVADTETGGLDPRRNPILTLSAAKTHGGGSFNVKIIPPEGLEISEEALAVTGISVEDLRENGIPEAEAVRRFSEFVGEGGHVIAGCNFPFDMRFLREMYRRCGAPMPISHHCVDLQTVAFLAHERGVVELPKSRGGVLLLNLDVVSAAFGVSRSSELHDSLEDVNLTQKCIEEGIDRIRVGAGGGGGAKNNLVVLDVETSGLDPRKHSVLRISAKRLDTGETYDTWVKPESGTYGDKKSMEKTGLDIAKIKEEGEPLKDALRGLQKFLGGCRAHILAGCNVAFDVDFIEHGCLKYGLRPPFGGKRVDLQSAAFVAHQCGTISLPMSDGKPDLSFSAIAGACGLVRGPGADRHPSDIELFQKCFTKCTGISFPGCKAPGDAGFALSKAETVGSAEKRPESRVL